MLELTIRLIASLAVVVGLLLLTAKFFGRQFQSRHGATIQVLHRQALSRSSAVSVVAIGPRVLVLGSTESQINVLAELDPDELDLQVAEAQVTTLRPVTDAADGASDFAASLEAASAEEDDVPDVADVAADAAETPAGKGSSADSPLASPAAEAVRQVGGQRRAPRLAARGSRSGNLADGEPKQGPLTGSILSPQTWRQAIAAARRVS